VSGLYACWRRQRQLQQLELAWRLSYVQQSLEKKKSLSSTENPTKPATVVDVVGERKRFVIDRCVVPTAPGYAECRNQ
jgi:hypothetical protein